MSMAKARETQLCVKMSRVRRTRWEKQAEAANRSLTAQVVWWIENTELDGITPRNRIDREEKSDGEMETEK